MIFIWAEDEQHGIGFQGNLPWHLPADMAFFKMMTTGHTLVSGSRTFGSYGGKALPHRKNLVLTSQSAEHFPADVTVLPDVSAVVAYERDHPAETVFISGGAQVFAVLMPYATTLLRTQVHASFDVDTYMPEIQYADFRKVAHIDHAVDDNNSVALTFERYDRR